MTSSMPTPTVLSTPARTALQSFFTPATVAVIGATDRDGSVGRTILANLIRGSYHGRVFAVNPRHSEILGTKCYPTVARLPAAIDLAVIATPALTVPGVMRDCVDAGVKSAIVGSWWSPRERWQRKAFPKVQRISAAALEPCESVDILGDGDAERYAKAVEVAVGDPSTDGLLVILAPQGMTSPAEAGPMPRALCEGTWQTCARQLDGRSKRRGRRATGRSPSLRAFRACRCRSR